MLVVFVLLLCFDFVLFFSAFFVFFLPRVCVLVLAGAWEARNGGHVAGASDGAHTVRRGGRTGDQEDHQAPV